MPPALKTIVESSGVALMNALSATEASLDPVASMEPGTAIPVAVGVGAEVAGGAGVGVGVGTGVGVGAPHPTTARTAIACCRVEASTRPDHHRPNRTPTTMSRSNAVINLATPPTRVNPGLAAVTR
jgi:hypothetical protein